MGIVILYHFGGIFTGKSFTGINGDFAPCKHLKFKLCQCMKIQGESTNSAVLRQKLSGFFLYALPWCTLFLVPNVKKKNLS